MCVCVCVCVCVCQKEMCLTRAQITSTTSKIENITNIVKKALYRILIQYLEIDTY